MAHPPVTPDGAAELTWEIAELFPAQGHWSEEEYLALDTNRLVEFSHGKLEIVEMPTFSHQRLVALLYRILSSFVERQQLGVVMFAPLRMRLWQGKYREPDVLFMSRENAEQLGEKFWHGADLVMEVVSPDDPRRDWVTKRFEYARAGIPEYWIVDPTPRTVTVLHLAGEQYSVHGTFPEGETATSVLLDGFSVPVSDVFAEIS